MWEGLNIFSKLKRTDAASKPQKFFIVFFVYDVALIKFCMACEVQGVLVIQAILILQCNVAGHFGQNGGLETGVTALGWITVPSEKVQGQ